MGMQQLSPRHRKTLKNLIDNPKEIKKAAEDAGFSESYALTVARNLLKRKPIIDALEKAGGTDEKIAKVLVEGLESEHPFRPGMKDPQSILGFAREINRILDHYPPTKIQSESKKQVMVVHFTSDSLKQNEKYRKMRGT